MALRELLSTRSLVFPEPAGTAQWAVRGMAAAAAVVAEVATMIVIRMGEEVEEAELVVAPEPKAKLVETAAVRSRFTSGIRVRASKRVR
jgi:hypothetical protein